MSRTISTKLALTGETEYRAKLKNINAELSLHKSELEKVQAQYKGSANSLEALTAKQSALRGQLDALNRKHGEQAAMLEKAQKAQREFSAQAEELRGRLEALQGSSADTAEEEAKLADELAAAEEGMQKAANSATFYQKQLNNTQRDQAKLGAELERTEQYLDEARASADGCAKSIDGYGKEVKDAGKDSQAFGETSRDAVNQLAAALAAAGIAKSVKEIADALMACVDTFASFQAQMSTVQAISGATGGQMEALTEKAKYMGATTSFTATEAGQALEYMAMAGWKTGDMLGGLEGIMHLAAASGEGLAATSDIVTDALTAFGLAASDSARFADVLAAASSNSNTNVGMMGETFKYAAPVAGALGFSIEDTALAIGLMANAGIKGSQAGTALRGTLTNLAKPSEEVAGYLERLGVSLTDNQGHVRSLSELMDVLRERFAQLTEAEKAEYAAGVAGKEAMSGLLAIVNASEADYRKLAAAIDTCNGSAKAMSETRLDNYAGQMTLLRSAADGLKLAVGEQLTPALTDLAQAGTEAFTWATEFVNENPWVVGAVTGVTVSLAALTVGVTLYEHKTELAAAKTAILNAVMNTNPAVFVASAMIGLVTAIGIYVASTGEADEETKQFTQALQESKAAYEDLMSTMAEQQASTGSAAAALKDMLAVEEKSATQKAVIKKLVDQLNEAVPELGLAYDGAADSINMTTDAIDAMLSKAAEQEEYDAQVERLSELYAEQTEISARLEEAELALANAQGEAREEMASYFDIAADYNNALHESNGGTSALENNVRALTAALEENEAQTAALEEASRAYGEQQAENTLKIETMTATVEGLVGEIAALQEEYEASRDAAYASIDAQLGLFNELDGTAKTSIDSLINTLKGQVEYMDTYAANIQRAMEMGVDEGLIRQLSNGEEESAQILDAIVKGGEGKVAALNEQFAKVKEGKESFSETIAEMEKGFGEKMDALVGDLEQAIQEMDMEDLAYQAGQNNIQGLLNGVSDPALRQKLINKYTQLGLDALAAYKKAVDQHSPSKEFEKAARFDVQGLIGGAEAERAKLYATYENLGKTSLAGYADGASEELEKALAQVSAAFKEFDGFFSVKADVGDLQYQLWERTEGKTAAESEKYAKQLELLSMKLTDQQAVVDAASDAYAAVAEQYGEGTAESYEYQKALLQEKLALQDLLDEIEKVTAARQEMARQEFNQQVKAKWEGSALGIAGAAAMEAGYAAPYEIARSANLNVVSQGGELLEAASQRALNNMAQHLPAIRRASNTQNIIGRQMEAMTAAVINAADGMARGGGGGPTSFKLMFPDGTEFASYYLDPMAKYADANGTPILNPKR